MLERLFFVILSIDKRLDLWYNKFVKIIKNILLWKNLFIL